MNYITYLAHGNIGYVNECRFSLLKFLQVYNLYPPADLGVIIYNYGESFLDRFYRVYPEAEDYVKRARFYAGAHEVRWLQTGIERNNPWWFAVHVGSAKDIK